MLRFKVWNTGGDDPGNVVVDPFEVAAVHETTGVSNYGRDREPIAVIWLRDGSEFTVRDEGRVVAAQVWAGKSVIT